MSSSSSSSDRPARLLIADDNQQNRELLEAYLGDEGYEIAMATDGKETLEQFFLAPIGRNATPEEMAEPLILLNSDAARFVSGHLLVVDYGYCGEVDVGLREGLL